MFAKYEDFYAFEGDFYANFYTSIIYLDRRVNFTITFALFFTFSPSEEYYWLWDNEFAHFRNSNDGAMRWGQNIFKIIKTDDLPATQTEKSWRKLTQIDKKKSGRL